MAVEPSSEKKTFDSWGLVGEECPSPRPSTAIELRRSRQNGLLSPTLSSKGGEGEDPEGTEGSRAGWPKAELESIADYAASEPGLDEPTACFISNWAYSRLAQSGHMPWVKSASECF